MIKRLLTSSSITLIDAYKYIISPLLGNNCRFLPTCSEYCIEALEKKGFFVGIFLTFKRILKCHPIKFLGAKSGFDPVEKDKLNG